MDLAIECRGLGKKYGGQWAVRDLDLAVPAGSVFGLLGPNGAGKTTTIKMLLGLVRPTTGAATVMGLDSQRDSVQIRRLVGYVPESQSLYPGFRVRDLLAFNRSLYESWDMALVGRYLDLFSLPAHKRVEQLSRGMRGQLALVLALATRPRLLILDEPASDLDPLRQQEFLSVILKEAVDAGQTVFMSSHSLPDVERVADRVAIIRAGRCVLAGAIDDLKTNMKRIRIVFQDEVPAGLDAWPGITGVDVLGKVALISVVSNLGEILDRLEGIPHLSMEIIDLNLKDIFFEYAGGGE